MTKNEKLNLKSKTEMGERLRVFEALNLRENIFFRCPSSSELHDHAVDERSHGCHSRHHSEVQFEMLLLELNSRQHCAAVKKCDGTQVVSI